MFADKNHPKGILTAGDMNHLRSTGRDPEQIIRQVEVLRQQRGSAPILRPAAINDGIQQLKAHDPDVLCLHEKAAAAGRISCFIPASGSGTRLFTTLFQLYRDQETELDNIRTRASQGDDIARDGLAILDNISHFAIWDELQQRGCSADSIEGILGAIFESGALGFHDRPKGLIPFHRYRHGIRTAFAEHLNEAALLVKDNQKKCRIHFTVASYHKDRFQNEWFRDQPTLERSLDARFHLTFSEQSPATDTIATDLQGNIRRDDLGRIVFRPGGHGALLENLAAIEGDIVLIKNIDNVARQELATKIVQVRRQISGLLLLIENQVHNAIRGLRKGQDADQALLLLDRQFGRRPLVSLPDEESRRNYAIGQLDRPIRVCGVVRSLHHTGGRPFWMEVENFGPWLQIVESAEVDLTHPLVRDLFQSSRYFNPVDIACSLRDVDGRPFDLNLFITRDRAIIAQKTLDGVPSLLYEHPGLWNGGMSLWNTVFIEIPDFAFNPVKSLSDLLASGHRQLNEVGSQVRG